MYPAPIIQFSVGTLLIKGAGDKSKKSCPTTINQIHHFLFLQYGDMLARNQQCRQVEENINLRLSIDNLLATTYAPWMRIDLCREDGTQKKLWKMRFVTLRSVVGV